MSKIKIVFVDIDWTLLNHAKKPAEFDLNSIFALKKAQENGVLVFLSTARSYHSIEQVGILDFFSPDGIIALNGGEIIFKDKIIHRIKVEENLFSRSAIRDIATITKDGDDVLVKWKRWAPEHFTCKEGKCIKAGYVPAQK